MSRLITHAVAPVASGKPLAAARLAELMARLLLEPLDGPACQSLCGFDTAALDDSLRTAVDRLCAVARLSDLEECGREYVRLFLDPRGAVCLPWESTWTEMPPRLMGRSHLEVLRWYSASGYEPVQASDPADHIALELGFVALLIGSGETARLRSFWRRHVVNWVPDFAKRLRERTRVPLYAALADLLEVAVRPIRRRVHAKEDAQAAPRV